MKRAYSYVRFSTAEQLKGKSLERQTEAARNYCKQHGLELDTDLSLHDLGVSAFRGKNATVGALGSFLKAVHAGQVPKGSYLLIETFDRMSRDSAYDAQLTLQNIINAGITVVTLLDGKQYNVSILRADPLALIYAILLMSRSHEESATKSKRLIDSWQRRRKELAPGKPLTSITPGWIRLDRNKKPQVIPERARIVQRIFREFLQGRRYHAIAYSLNGEGVPSFGGGKRGWSPTYLRLLLRSRAVIGEFQPHRCEHSPSGGRKRIPDGAPVKGYWPAIVDAKTWRKVQELIKKSRRPPRSAGLKNILAGLACCSFCGGPMERTLGERSTGPRIVCSRARAGLGCTFRSARLAVLEAALAANAAKLGAVPVPETDETATRLETAKSELETIERRIVDMALLLSDTPSKTVAARIRDDEAAAEQLRQEIAELTARAQFSSARRLRDAVTRMQSALQWHATDPSDVAGVNSALRECFEKIVVDVPRRQLEMHWRHGRVSRIDYAEACSAVDTRPPARRVARGAL